MLNNYNEGTLEYYRSIYMTDGLRAMVEELKRILELGDKPVTPESVNGFLKAILYGGDDTGKVRLNPPIPNINDLTDNYERYRFEKIIYGIWVGNKTKGVKQ